MMNSKPALPVKPCTIRIMDSNGENVVLLENNNSGNSLHLYISLTFTII